MQRTQISLTERERRLLDDVSRRTGRSMSALIREAVSQTYGRGDDVDAGLAALRASAGAWADRTDDVDGEAYVEALRSGRRLRR